MHVLMKIYGEKRGRMKRNDLGVILGRGQICFLRHQAHLLYVCLNKVEKRKREKDRQIDQPGERDRERARSKEKRVEENKRERERSIRESELRKRKGKIGLEGEREAKESRRGLRRKK